MTHSERPGATKTRDEIAAAYKAEPWWYDVRGFMILTFAYNSTIGRQLRLFGPNFGARHLEVACGTGTLLAYFLAWRKRRNLPIVEIVGVDYAESMLAGARNRFKKFGNLTFYLADVASMPFEPESFDTANIANAIHCFPDVEAGLRGVYAVLKPGGTLAANVLLYPRGSGVLKTIAMRINNWGIEKGILFTPYTHDEIRRIFVSVGFNVIDEVIVGNCYDVNLKRPVREVK